jgi:hypothetical protein
MTLLNTLMDALMSLLGRLPPAAALACFSVLAGALVLLLFKVSSRPERIAAARNRALARVLELWLWREDAVGGLFSVGRAMRESLLYLATMGKPALVSAVPMLLLLVQAHAWFGVRPLREGETALVVVRAAADGVVGGLALEGGPDVAVEASVTSDAAREKAWRIRAGAGRGMRTLRLTGAGVDEVKQVSVGRGLMRVSARRGSGFWDRLLYPDEPGVRAPLASVTVACPEATYAFFGVRSTWLPALLVISLCAGLALKRPLGVEF